MENRTTIFKDFKFTIVSLSCPTNKNYVKCDGQIIKTSSANSATGDLKVYVKDSIEGLAEEIKKLQINEALICGKPINEIIEAKITYKGNENLDNKIISRSNEYLELNEEGNLICIDHDPDENLGLVVDSGEDLYKKMIELVPELEHCECLITQSSSSLVFDSETQLPLKKYNGFHLYFIACMVTIGNLKNFIEYLKRQAIELDKFAIKIDKNGSSRAVYIYDEMPLKLTQSGLKFETIPTVASPLILLEKKYIYKNQGSKRALDLSKFDINSLPDPSLKIEKAKLEKKDEIEKIRNKYIESKIGPTIVNYKCSEIEAQRIIKNQIETSELNVNDIIYTDKSGSKYIWDLIVKPNCEINCADPLDPQKGQSKAVFYTNYIFDCIISSRVRGGISYQIAFTIEQIGIILKHQNKYYPATIDKVLNSLSKYIIRKNLSSNDILAISNILNEDKDLQDKFQKIFDVMYVNNKMLKLMKNYACIVIEPNFFMLDISKDKLYIIKVATLKNQLLNKHIKSFFEGKYYEPVDLYLKSNKRVTYDQIVFKDFKDVKKFEYNIFKGWEYKAKKSVDVDFFLNFIREIIANDNQDIYNYIIAFIAHMFQKPFEKMGTALFINGPQGAGKSFFVNTIGSLMGIHFFATSDPNLIFGKFNSHLLPVILLYPNESFFSGNRSDSSKLKSIITEIKMPIEQKGIPAFDGFNYSRIMLDTNDLYIQHTERWDRRYVYTEASSKRVGDLKFFSDMYKITSSKEFKESLMYFFMTFDYSEYEYMLRKAIMTKTKKDQILESLSPVESWWFNCLTEGYITNADQHILPDGTLLISNSSLHESYLDYCKQHNHRYPKGNVQFGKEIHKNLFNESLIINDNTKYNGKNAKVYATLDKLRDYFTKNYHLEFQVDKLSINWIYKTDIQHNIKDIYNGNILINNSINKQQNLPQGIPIR